jgi:hypothetical protein
MTEREHGDAFDRRAEYELDELTLPEPGSADFTSIERFAASLDRIDTTGAPGSWLAIAGIEPAEDPELASLLGTASALHGSLEAATEERAFQSFHHRSRAAVVHLLEQDLAPSHRGGRVGATVVRFRRHTLFAPLTAGVAAASVAAVAIFGGFVPGFAQPVDNASVANLTPRSTNEELVRISLALGTIREHSERGEAVPAPLLREVAEGTARVASIIEEAPGGVDAASVQNYSKTIEDSQEVLESAQTSPDDVGALASAHLAIREGAAVALRFLEGADTAATAADGTATPGATGTPSATPTPAPTSTPTPEPTPTGTPVHEPEPTATPAPTPTGTPVHEPDPTQEPTATATPEVEPEP